MAAVARRLSSAPKLAYYDGGFYGKNTIYVLELHFEEALGSDATLRVLDGLRAAVHPPAMLVRGDSR